MRHITTTFIGILITTLISTTTWAEGIDKAGTQAMPSTRLLVLPMFVTTPVPMLIEQT